MQPEHVAWLHSIVMAFVVFTGGMWKSLVSESWLGAPEMCTLLMTKAIAADILGMLSPRAPDVTRLLNSRHPRGQLSQFLPGRIRSIILVVLL